MAMLLLGQLDSDYVRSTSILEGNYPLPEMDSFVLVVIWDKPTLEELVKKQVVTIMDANETKVTIRDGMDHFVRIRNSKGNEEEDDDLLFELIHIPHGMPKVWNSLIEEIIQKYNPTVIGDIKYFDN